MSNVNSLFVIAELKLNEGVNPQECRRELLKLSIETLKEPECYQFKVFWSEMEVSKIFLFEEFKNKSALDEHFKMEHTKYYISKNLTEIVSASYLFQVTERA